ncbi:hypothetical protein [Mycobacteroides abscessus]|uniref:hypothetical protein n=1 Tax=Mycobacteroides abscessus TaxID=36809 RepID=UPI001055FA75|nr:hypothetical protein [Mycobacteroides abscessus]
MSDPGDDPREANAVFNQVVQATTTLTDALQSISHRHRDAAPVSAEHVLHLQSVLSTEVLAWIWRWPA